MTTLATSAIAREDAKAEVQRFLEYCRNRRDEHAAAGNAVQRLSAWLKAQPKPATIEEMAKALRLSEYTVRNATSRNSDKFVVVDRLPRIGRKPGQKLWRVREGR